VLKSRPSHLDVFLLQNWRASPDVSMDVSIEQRIWAKCDRTDTSDEKWVLFGQELSGADITRIMEERWYTPLRMIHVPEPMENSQTIHFTRCLVGDEEDEEVSCFEPTDPLQLFKDLSNWNPSGPSMPMHFKDLRME
jgi:hypothetical protein